MKLPSYHTDNSGDGVDPSSSIDTMMRESIVRTTRSLLVIGGTGAVASCAVPLIYREFQFARVTVLDMKVPTHPLPLGAKFHLECFSEENYADILEKYTQAGDICLNLSVLDSAALFIWCMENDVMYLDTSSESWPEAESATLENRTNFRDASLSRLHQKRKNILADLYERFPDKQDWATCVVQHGMNPGLVNQFVKHALQDISTTLLEREAGCQNRVAIEKYLHKRDWGRLSQALGVKAVHISERDTQRSVKPRNPGEFHSTWSVEGFLVELKDYAEIGLGTHEKRIPSKAHVFTGDNDVSAILGSKALNMRMMSWVPSGPIQGFPCPHDESITMASFLEVRNDEGALDYRPTVTFVYMPCDASLASIHEFAMTGYSDPIPVLLRDDTITEGEDEVGVLLLGHELGAWWTGTRLGIDRARSILPGHNATTMQVAAGVIGALSWMLKNPKAGFNLPEHITHEEVIRAARPYIEPFVSVQSDWSPLVNRSPLSMYDYIDRFGTLGNGEDAPCVPKREDEWQLATLLVQPSGNVWVPSPTYVEPKYDEPDVEGVSKGAKLRSSGDDSEEEKKMEMEMPSSLPSLLLSPWRENALAILPLSHAEHNSCYDLTMKQKVPDGMRIGRTSYGWGLFAKRAFSRGEIVYQGHTVTIPNDYSAKFLLLTDQGEYETDAVTHSCRKGEEDGRWLYGFDGFYNHSCRPNTYSAETEVSAGGLEATYITVASKDINVGDEISCDYDLFEWDCHDKGIDKCMCGSSNCRGSVRGFKFWPIEEQIAKLGTLECNDLLLSWIEANPKTVYQILRAIPTGVRIASSPIDGEWGLRANHALFKGDTIFENQAILIPQPSPEKGERDLLVVSCPDPSWTLDTSSFIERSTPIHRSVVKTGDDRYMYTRAPLATKSFDWKFHTEIRSRNSETWIHEFFSFDTFCNHGCTPSGVMAYDDNQNDGGNDRRIGPTICNILDGGRLHLQQEGRSDCYKSLDCLPGGVMDNVLLIGREANPVDRVEGYRMIACTDISKDEEITCDYSDLLGTEVGYVIEECKCGSEGCRGRVVC